ncbi:MAG: hypothetical protein AB7S26_18615 [Sandaracinaceae bacterium]
MSAILLSCAGAPSTETASPAGASTGEETADAVPEAEPPESTATASRDPLEGIVDAPAVLTAVGCVERVVAADGLTLSRENHGYIGLPNLWVVIWRGGTEAPSGRVRLTFTVEVRDSRVTATFASFSRTATGDGWMVELGWRQDDLEELQLRFAAFTDPILRPTRRAAFSLAALAPRSHFTLDELREALRSEEAWTRTMRPRIDEARTAITRRWRGEPCQDNGLRCVPAEEVRDHELEPVMEAERALRERGAEIYANALSVASLLECAPDRMPIRVDPEP